MDSHVEEYFSQFGATPEGKFHRVILLNNAQEISFKELLQHDPKLSKGWYELAHLPREDRISFTRDFWLSKLPYEPHFAEFLTRFFEGLDDILIFLTQRTFDDPFETTMVYCLQGDNGFFRGALPASEEETSQLQEAFPEVILPADYIAFLQIHNGFSKATDTTGITPSTKMFENYNAFQDLIQQEKVVTTGKDIPIDPKSLIPFYESFGMPFFQCFWSEWYPEQEMGNVYYSGITKSISDIESSDPAEGMAFPTFLNWLMFYLERIDY